MATLPPINATVTEVREPPSTETWRNLPGPPDLGPVRWLGTAPANASERVLTDTAGGVVTQLKVARLAVPSYVPVEPDDEVTYTKAGTTQTRRVRSIEERSDYGFTRIHFYDL